MNFQLFSFGLAHFLLRVVGWYFIILIQILTDYTSSQCYSVLSDILVKNELFIPLERGSTVLSTGEGFICLSPPIKLKIAMLFCSIYKKDNFVQCYSVLSDFHPTANDDYVTQLGEFSVKLFYLHKVTSLREFAKFAVTSLTNFRIPKLKRFVCLMTNKLLNWLLLGPNIPLSHKYNAN